MSPLGRFIPILKILPGIVRLVIAHLCTSHVHVAHSSSPALPGRILKIGITGLLAFLCVFMQLVQAQYTAQSGVNSALVAAPVAVPAPAPSAPPPPPPVPGGPLGGGARRPLPAAASRTAPPQRNKPQISQSPQGLRNFYAQVGLGWLVEDGSQGKPSAPGGGADAPKAQETPMGHYAVPLYGLIGWGPLRWDEWLLNTSYKYSQNWDIPFDQVLRFMNDWWAGHDRTADNFVVTTTGLLRTHEFAVDTRYVTKSLQAGLFTRFTYSRVGSSQSFLGAKDESAQTVAVTENFLPYVSFQYQNIYRGQVYFPFRTEINRDDPNLSNKSYSWSSKGRGRPTFSATWNNAFYLPPIRSFLFFDAFFNDSIYNTIQYDRTRMGIAAALDIPVVLDLRVSPKLVFYNEKYFVPRIRVLGGSSDPPEEVVRTDTMFRYGIVAYYHLFRSHRLQFDAFFSNQASTIQEFKSSSQLFKVSYVYSWPSTMSLLRKTSRFPENSFAEDF